MYLVHGCFAV